MSTFSKLDSSINLQGAINYKIAQPRIFNLANSAESNQWRGIVYGDNVYAAVARSGTNRAMTSPDAINWTPRSTPTGNWESIAYGNGYFAAVATGGAPTHGAVMYSSNAGVTWNPGVLTTASVWTGIAYGNGIWVAVAYSGPGSSRVAYTNNPALWNNASTGFTGKWWGVTYNSTFKKFIVFGDEGTILTSLNGVNWTIHSNVVPNVGWLAGVTDGTGRTVIVGPTDPSAYYSDDGGISWYNGNGDVNSNWNGIAASQTQNTFVAIADTGTNRIMTSLNGTEWTTLQAPTNIEWRDITNGDNKFVAIGATTGNLVQVMWAYD
jgi:hypothetical protein